MSRRQRLIWWAFESWLQTPERGIRDDIRWGIYRLARGWRKTAHLHRAMSVFQLRPASTTGSDQ